MAKLNMFYFKHICLLLIAVCTCASILFSQGNCLLYPEDSGERKACELSYEAITYKQGSKESQDLFDQAIKIGPNYAYAYYQKSTPFFKRGMFAEGVSLINKAIELEPENYLFYRAYYFFYNHSYDFCNKDLEELYTKHNTTYMTTPGGELEMRLILGMSYAQSGNLPKGIEWVLDLMDTYKSQPQLKGFFDHYILGVLYYKNNQFDLAKSAFEKQLIVEDNFADTYYYLGLIADMESNSEMAESYLKQALSKINREQGGFSKHFFGAYNINKELIKNALNN